MKDEGILSRHGPKCKVHRGHKAEGVVDVRVRVGSLKSSWE